MISSGHVYLRTGSKMQSSIDASDMSSTTVGLDSNEEFHSLLLASFFFFLLQSLLLAAVCGRPERLSSSTLSLPSLKHRYHSKACVCNSVSLPYTCFKILYVPVALFSKRTQNLIFVICLINAISFNRRRVNASAYKIRRRGEPTSM
ncbi:hypothetical protein TNCV_2377171 [Trichonephila clavipes]|nr:hypothetical protein TNCV_2377171 [Trichonephila clavipes]